MFYWLAKKKESRDLIMCKIWLDMEEEMSNTRIANYTKETKVGKGKPLPLQAMQAQRGLGS